MANETFDISSLALNYAVWLSTITQQLMDWDYSEVSGSGRYRGHDRFALLEISISKNDNPNSNLYSDQNVLVWSVDPSSFPDDIKEMGLPSLKQLGTFLLYHIQAIKGERVQLRMEIKRAGFGLTDDWGRACCRAMCRAIVSCFDEHEHAINEEYAAEWFARVEKNGRKL
jgi:hypothetical protein